jgi:alcohol dehydrogenase class IV
MIAYHGAMHYEFATAGRIIVGPGSSAQLAELVPPLGRALLLVHSAGAPARGGAVAEVIHRLASGGSVASRVVVRGEPTVATVAAAAETARQAGCDCVVGIGGGSVLDTAKAAAALATNDGDALRYLEVVGEGRALERPALPVVAVPTTAGTGSEATRNAVLGVPERRVKASMRHASMLPRLAVVDSRLTHELPPDMTASTGMDALTQLIEAFVSRRATPLTDALCRGALPGLDGPLLRAFHHPDDEAARATVSEAALWSGMALANAGLGAVHGLAAVVGGAFDAPHGAVCAALLPSVTAANIAALARDPGSAGGVRYQEVARLLYGEHGTPADLVRRLRELVAGLGIGGLAHYGITPDAAPALAAAATQASSTRANPVTLEARELEEALLAAM